jgi:hypothetical protein
LLIVGSESLIPYRLLAPLIQRLEDQIRIAATYPEFVDGLRYTTHLFRQPLDPELDDGETTIRVVRFPEVLSIEAWVARFGNGGKPFGDEPSKMLGEPAAEDPSKRPDGSEDP